MESFFQRLFARKDLLPATRKASTRRPIRNRPTLEQLEDRVVPATVYWTGQGGDGLWSDGNNWLRGGLNVAPVAGDSLVFTTNLVTTSNGNTLNTSSTAYNTVDDIHDLTVANITFDNVDRQFGANPFAEGGAAKTGTTGYTISGNGILPPSLPTSTGFLGFTGAAGITVTAGLATGGAGNVASQIETFGANLPLQNSVATTFLDSDINTQLTINGTVATSAIGSTLTLSDVGNGTSNNAGLPGINMNGVISGAAPLSIGDPTSGGADTGTVLLGAVNTYTGGTTVFSGTAIVAASNATGSGLGVNSGVLPGPLAVITDVVTGPVDSPANDGQILLTNGVTVQQSLDIRSDANGGALSATTSPLNPTLTTDTWIGPILLHNVGGSNDLSIGAGLTPTDSATRLIINPSTSPANAITNTGTVAILSFNGSGTIELGQANGYTVTAQQINGVDGFATVQIDNSTALGTGPLSVDSVLVSNTSTGPQTPPPSATVPLNGGTLLLNGNLNVTNALNLSGAGVNGQGALNTVGTSSPLISGVITLNGAADIGVSGAGSTLTVTGGIVNGTPTADKLFKVGAGKMIISGTAGTYTGGTEIVTGIINAQVTNALGTAGTVTVDNNATLQVQDTTGVVTLPNNLVFLGTTPAAGASASLEDVSATGTGITAHIGGIIQLLGAGGGQVSISEDYAGNDLFLDGPITNTGGPAVGGGLVINPVNPGVPQTGGNPNIPPVGEVVMHNNSNNTYGGTTTVAGGTLLLDPTAPGIISVPGTLVVGGFLPNTVAAGLTDFALVTEFIQGSMAANQSITVNAGSRFDLDGNTLSVGPLSLVGGDFDVDGGALTLTQDVNATAFVDLKGVFRGSFIDGGGTVGLNVASAGGSRTFTVTQPATLPAIDQFDLNVTSQVIDGSANLASLIKAGNGVMNLGAANTYSGKTTVTGGVLVATDALALGAGDGASDTAVSVSANASLTVVSVTIADHLLALNGPGFLDPVTGIQGAALQGYSIFGIDPEWTQNITVAPDISANASTFGEDDGGDLKLRGVVSGTGGVNILADSVLKTGEVIFTDTGTALPDANTYSGTTTVQAGGILVLNKEYFPAAGVTPETAVPGALVILGNTNTAAPGTGPGVVKVNFGKLVATAGAPAGSEIGTIATPSPVTINGGSLLLRNTAQQAVAAVAMSNAGNISLANTSQLQLTAGLSATGALVGANTITSTGGVLLLKGASQTITVNPVLSGSSEVDLNVSAPVGLAPTPTGGLIKNGGGTMEFSGAGVTNSQAFTTINAGTLILAAGPAASKPIPYGTVLTIGSGTGAAGSVTVRDIANNQLGAAGIGFGNPGASVVINSDGLLDINSRNDAVAGNAGQPALTMNGGEVNIGAAAGNLVLNGNVTVPTGSALIFGVGNIDLGGGTNTFDVASGASLTVSASMGDGSLTKTDAGRLLVTANNTYGGTTNIQGGVMTINGNQPQSQVVIAAGAKLSGNGNVGPVFNSGNEDPPEVHGDDNFLAGSSLGITITGPNTVNNTNNTTELFVTGAANLNGNPTLNLTIVPGTTSGTYDIVHADGGVVGTFANAPTSGSTITVGGVTATVTYTSTDVFVTLGAAAPAVNTTTVVSSAPNPSTFGQTVTFTAVVTAASGATSPAGSVSFIDTSNGNAVVGTASSPSSTGSGTATYTATSSTLSVGNHIIKAIFTPTNSNAFNSSNGTEGQANEGTVQVVNSATAVNTTTVVSSAPNPSVSGQTVTFTAVVTAASGATPPAGSVSFIDTSNGNAVVGTASSPSSTGSGTATYTATSSTLSVGNHIIEAVFTPTNSNAFNSSNGTEGQANEGTVQVVNAAAVGTTTVVSSAPNPSAFGQTVTFTAVVTAASGATPPAGSVSFIDTSNGNAIIGTASSPSSTGSGTATYTVTSSTLSAGNHIIEAVFTPTNSNAFSGSTGTEGQVNEGTVQAVGANSTSSSVGSNNNPAAFGASVTFTDTVTNTGTNGVGAPTGTVQFKDGATLLGGPQTLTPGAGLSSTATFTTSTLSSGSHQITAVYTPADANYVTSTSPILTETITPATSPIFPAVLRAQTTFFGGVGSELDVFDTNTHTLTNVQAGQQLQATWSAVTSVRDAAGNEDIFATIAQSPGGSSFVGTVWEYQVSPSGAVTAIGENSSGHFQSISAATNAAGQAVLFVVSTVGNVYEQTPASGNTDANWVFLNNPVAMSAVSAITPTVGGNPVIYTISSASHDVYEDSTVGGANTFNKVSTSSGAATISAGVTAAGNAEVYVLGQDGSLVQISPNLNGGTPTQLSAPGSIKQIAAGSSPDLVYVVTTGHNDPINSLWQFKNGVASALDQTHKFGQLSATSASAVDEVFSAMADGTLGEVIGSGAFTDFGTVTGVNGVAVPH